MIKSLRLKPVAVKNANERKDKTDYEKKKFVSLKPLTNNGMEIDPERKLRVAVLNFRNGTGGSWGR